MQSWDLMAEDIGFRNEVRVKAVDGPRPVVWRDDYAIHLLVGQMTERVVVAYRDLNKRLGWVANPDSLDRFIRAIASFHLAWARRNCPAEWPANGLESVAISLQDELMEELERGNRARQTRSPTAAGLSLCAEESYLHELLALCGADGKVGRDAR